jgi:hypothetical protein
MYGPFGREAVEHLVSSIVSTPTQMPSKLNMHILTRCYIWASRLAD